jgi:hypothetical protein
VHVHSLYVHERYSANISIEQNRRYVPVINNLNSLKARDDQ